MSDNSSLVKKIHASPLQLVIYMTGGGSRLVSDLLNEPGASRTVLEASIPYSGASLRNLLGSRNDPPCDSHTARAMAMVALWRAQTLATDSPHTDSSLIGIGCTAALATDRIRKGSHRAHLAIQTIEATHTASLTLEKGKRTRIEEENLVADMILDLLGQTAHVLEPPRVELTAQDRVQHVLTTAPELWRDLFSQTRQSVYLSAQPTTGLPKAIFPGAFDPLHRGHERMAEFASQRLGSPIDFEISVINVDKPMLDYTTLVQRVSQFSDQQGLWLTRAPTFVEKAKLFPGVVFVVGVDTVIRIGDARYYGNNPLLCCEAISQLTESGCRFLVFGRIDEQRFQTLSKSNLPESLLQICDEVSEDQFREDVSSTDIRAGTVRW